MTYSDPYVYLRATGFFNQIGLEQEEWSVGFKLLSPSGSVNANSLAAFLDTVALPIQTFHTNTGLKSGSSAILKQLSAAVVGIDGKYVGGGSQATTVRPYPTPIAGNATSIHPWGTALCLSLRTSQKRGRASNGRAYWPALALTTGPNDGLVASATTLSVANAAATMLNAINQAADTILNDCLGLYVMSNLDSGISAPVTGIRIGNKMDHVETREKGIKEAYSLVSVTVVPAIRELVDRDDLVGATPYSREPTSDSQLQ